MASQPYEEPAQSRLWLSWSSGKDSAWSLHLLQQQHAVVSALVTTVDADTNRVAQHGVHRAVVEAQAKQLGIPVISVPLPQPCSNVLYEATMAAVFKRAIEADVHQMAFGDLFLADIRQYREGLFQGTGLTPIFPLWGFDTRTLARRMIAEGIRAMVTAIDSRKLSSEWIGRSFDEPFLDDLPDGVDPCGERGEFHTVTVDGPMFREAISVVFGPLAERDGFVHADVTLER